MFDDVDNVIELLVESIQHVHHESLVTHWSLDVLQEIRNGLKTLRVLVHCLISNFFGAKIVVELYRSATSNLKTDSKP